MPEMPDAERQKGQRPKARNARCRMPEMPKARNAKCQMLNARKAKGQKCQMLNAGLQTPSFLASVILGIRHSWHSSFPPGLSRRHKSNAFGQLTYPREGV
jgi:hypothetical protein